MARNDRTRRTPLIVFDETDVPNSGLNDLLGIQQEELAKSVTEVVQETSTPVQNVQQVSPIVQPEPVAEQNMPEQKILEQKPSQDVPLVVYERAVEEEQPVTPVIPKPVMPNIVYKEPTKAPERHIVQQSFFEEDAMNKQEPVQAVNKAVPAMNDRFVHNEDRSVVQESAPVSYAKQEVSRPVPPVTQEPVYQRPQEPPVKQTVSYQGQTAQGREVYPPSAGQQIFYDERENMGQPSYTGGYATPPANGGAVPFTQQLHAYEYAKVQKQETRHHAYKNQIITVYSPKGGVGKSTLAKEIALALSSSGPNKETYKVLLIDADWESPDVATLFNVRNIPNMIGLVKSMRKERSDTGRISIRSKQELSQYLIPYRNEGIENLDLLVSSTNAMDHALVDEYVVRALIENYRTCDYDFIIFDSANSIQGRSLLPLMVADHMVLVETWDVTTILETTSLMQALREKQFDFNKIRMVLNMVPTDMKNMDVTAAEIGNLLKLQIAATIPNVGETARLMNNACESFVLGKDSPVSREIKKLVNTITPCYKEPKKGFFARLFGKK